MPLGDEHADHGVQHRLGHGPAQQRRFLCDGLRRPVEVFDGMGIALRDETAAVNHDRGVCQAQRSLLVEQVVEQRLERHALRCLARRPRLGRPRDTLRLCG